MDIAEITGYRPTSKYGPKPRPIEDRFWEKVDKTSDANGCWLWTGCVNTWGYGQINKGGQKGAHIGAARLSWMIKNGPIGAGLCVCHKCDNPICVNPDHLFLGTQKDNMVDAQNKGHRAYGSKNVNARFCDDDIRNIRKMYEDGYRQKDIVDHYGASKSAISAIVRRKTWLHVK